MTGTLSQPSHSDNLNGCFPFMEMGVSGWPQTHHASRMTLPPPPPPKCGDYETTPGLCCTGHQSLGCVHARQALRRATSSAQTHFKNQNRTRSAQKPRWLISFLSFTQHFKQTQNRMRIMPFHARAHPRAKGKAGWPAISTMASSHQALGNSFKSW